MRKRLDDVQAYPDHRGLAYEVWAPVDKDTGKLKQDQVSAWLKHICKPDIPQGYQDAYRRWLGSFHPGRDVMFEVCTESRLLIGHGNPAPTEVGITLHHTWGVPVLPGSALKGLTAHFVATCYGADPDECAPEREAFRGPSYENGRVTRPPGDMYRRIFGAPSVNEAGNDASPGEVVFHDALWIPKDSADWLARDVLTVHQKTYYQGRDRLPNDYDEPIPVAFLGVPKEVGFLVALSCEDDALRRLAARFVEEALVTWGIGGKTSAGYGRMSVQGSKKLAAPPAGGSPVVAAFEGWLESSRNSTDGELLQHIEREWLPRLRSLTPAEQDRIEKRLLKKIKDRSKQRDKRDDLLRRMRER